MLDDDRYNYETDFSFIDDPNEYQENEDLDDDLPWLKLSSDSQDTRVDNAVQYLMEQHKFPHKKKSVKKCLRLIVINVIRLLREGKSSLIYHRGSTYYSDIRKDMLKNPLCITRSLPDVIDVLKEEGYLEGETGFYVPPEYANYGRSKCSSIRPLDKMKNLIAAYDLPDAKIGEASNIPPIAVRIKGEKIEGKKKNGKKKRKKDIVYRPRGKAVSEMERKLSIINDPLAHIEISLSQGTSTPKNICFDGDYALHRIFNDHNLKTGGRFYGGPWQRLPPEKRSKILINGEPTVELDFSGQHIGMLYAVLGLKIPDNRREDPYRYDKVSRFPRPLIKKSVLTAINSTRLYKAWRATLSDLRIKKWKSERKLKRTTDAQEISDLKEKIRQLAEFIELIRYQDPYEEIIKEFLAIHPFLKDGMYKGWGSKLQCLDATVAEHIQYEMALKEIAVLCVHDSFIIQERHKSELLAVMKEAYLQSPDPVIQKSYTSIKDSQKTVYHFIDTPSPAPISKSTLKCPVPLRNKSAVWTSDASVDALPEPQPSVNSH